MNMSQTTLTRFVRIVVAGMLAAPVIVYMVIFGTHVTHSSEEWSRMGSAMAGIYGPILAFLTLAILTLQVRLQQESSKHMFDEARLRTMDADVIFYLTRLETVLQANCADGLTVRQQIADLLMYAPIEKLQDPEVQNEANRIGVEHSRIGPAWMAFQSILAGLAAAADEREYQLLLSTTRSRATVVLSFEMCVALDNFVWCYSSGHAAGPFMYSDQVRLGIEQSRVPN